MYGYDVRLGDAAQLSASRSTAPETAHALSTVRTPDNSYVISTASAKVISSVVSNTALSAKAESSSLLPPSELRVLLNMTPRRRTFPKDPFAGRPREFYRLNFPNHRPCDRHAERVAFKGYELRRRRGRHKSQPGDGRRRYGRFDGVP